LAAFASSATCCAASAACWASTGRLLRRARLAERLLERGVEALELGVRHAQLLGEVQRLLALLLQLGRLRLQLDGLLAQQGIALLERLRARGGLLACARQLGLADGQVDLGHREGSTAAVLTEATAVTTLTSPDSQYTGCQNVHTSMKCVPPQATMNRPKATKT
jgi:hypothetical protein